MIATKLRKRSKILSNGIFFSFIYFIALSTAQKQSAVAQSSTCVSSSGHDLPIAAVPQEADMWCWAASIQMAVNYLRPTTAPLRQCEIAGVRVTLQRPASLRLRPSLLPCNCRQIKNKCRYYRNQVGACATYFQLLAPLTRGYRSNTDTIAAIVKQFGLKTTVIDTGANCLQRIKTSLCNNRPVIGIYLNGGGHVVLIKGFQMIAGVTNLLVNNPLYNTAANCKACLHSIQTNESGQNINSNLAAGTGTYSSLVFMSVHP